MSDYFYDDDDYEAMMDSLDERHRRRMELLDEEGEAALTAEERNPNLR